MREGGWLPSQQPLSGSGVAQVRSTTDSSRAFNGGERVRRLKQKPRVFSSSLHRRSPPRWGRREAEGGSGTGSGTGGRGIIAHRREVAVGTWVVAPYSPTTPFGRVTDVSSGQIALPIPEKKVGSQHRHTCDGGARRPAPLGEPGNLPGRPLRQRHEGDHRQLRGPRQGDGRCGQDVRAPRPLQLRDTSFTRRAGVATPRS